jgi:hypothetical protein
MWQIIYDVLYRLYCCIACYSDTGQDILCCFVRRNDAGATSIPPRHCEERSNLCTGQSTNLYANCDLTAA